MLTDGLPSSLCTSPMAINASQAEAESACRAADALAAADARRGVAEGAAQAQRQAAVRLRMDVQLLARSLEEIERELAPLRVQEHAAHEVHWHAPRA